MEYILNIFLSNHERCRSIGTYIITVSGFIGVCGLIGFAVKAVTNITLPGSPVHLDKQLSDIYPSLITFWIPESEAGFGMVVSAFIIGWVVVWLANELERYVRY